MDWNLNKRDLNENINIIMSKNNFNNELEKIFDNSNSKKNFEGSNKKGLFDKLKFLDNDNNENINLSNSLNIKTKFNINEDNSIKINLFNNKETQNNFLFNNDIKYIKENKIKYEENKEKEEDKEDEEEENNTNKNHFDFKSLKNNENIQNDIEEIINFEVLNFKIDDKSPFGNGLISIEKNKINNNYFLIFRNVFKILYSGIILNKSSKIINIKNKEDMLSGFSFSFNNDNENKKIIKNNFKIQFIDVKNAVEFKNEFLKII